MAGTTTTATDCVQSPINTKTPLLRNDGNAVYIALHSIYRVAKYSRKTHAIVSIKYILAPL